MAGALEIIQVIAEMALAGQQILNIYHAISSSAVDDDDLMIDLGRGLEQVYDQFLANLANDLTFVSLKFNNVSDETFIGEGTWPTFTAGGSSGQFLPLGVAGLITLPTSQPKVRGRKFFAGFTEGDITDGVWDSSLTNALVDAGAILVDPFAGFESGEPWAFGVVNQSGVFKDFISFGVSNIPAYQRRRKQGVGD